MNQDDFFTGTAGRFSGKAHALLDVMGGTAGHAGSLTLTLPLQAHVAVTAARRADRLLRLRYPDTSHTADRLLDPVLPVSENNPWATCAAATLQALTPEAGPAGADIQIAATLPLTESLSVTTAVVTALLRALAPAFGLPQDISRSAVLVQQVCQALGGTSGGLRAPLACLSGMPGQLLPVLCQPGHPADPIALPPGIGFAAVWLPGGPGTGRRQADARTAAAMGYALAALRDGTYPHELAQARDTGRRDHLLYNGYPANIEPRDFEDRYSGLPPVLPGSVFLEKAGVAIDADVRPDTDYPVLAATRHAVYENTRTQYFSLLLQHLPPAAEADRRQKSLLQLGQWMYQSHEGQAACGGTSPGTDAFVAAARAAAPAGVYGARATEDGAVCLLWAGDEGWQTVRRLCAEHTRRFGEEAVLIA